VGELKASGRREPADALTRHAARDPPPPTRDLRFEIWNFRSAIRDLPPAFRSTSIPVSRLMPAARHPAPLTSHGCRRPARESFRAIDEERVPQAQEVVVTLCMPDRTTRSQNRLAFPNSVWERTRSKLRRRARPVARVAERQNAFHWAAGYQVASEAECESSCA